MLGYTSEEQELLYRVGIKDPLGGLICQPLEGRLCRVTIGSLNISFQFFITKIGIGLDDGGAINIYSANGLEAKGCIGPEGAWEWNSLDLPAKVKIDNTYNPEGR